MTQVIVQPAAGPEARLHFANTIEMSIPLSRIRPHMSEMDYQRLAGFYDGEDVWVWGARPGVYSKWARIQTGDIVMFYRDKKFIRTARATFICQNRELANNLWGKDPDGETWEYIYFVDDLQEVDIPVQDFCAVVPYKLNFTPQGLMVLDQEKSDRVLEAYGLAGDNRRLQKLVDAIDAEPDRPALVNVRGEQSILRRGLLNGRIVAPCSICGENLPEDLLVAAHIKKRAECSREEKLDPQVVVLMCKLGCDSMYEYGYLSVEQGKVATKPQANDLPRITELLRKLDGRNFPEWNDTRATYFAWHTANLPRSN